ncbi:Ribonuclease H1 [Phytophthora ramorum]|uniref:ribonuclease H n=1 Tax=Phytophthora ramorum TaxID=164328 RepID=H3GUN7_PHYRM|nr:Ribonuclease H1 [Phytophthora ramorum]
MAKGGFYAVAAGRSPGVFTTWAECEAQVKGFIGCRYKKFKSSTEAQAYIDAHNRQNGVTSVAPEPNPTANPKRPRDESVDNVKTSAPPAKKPKQSITSMLQHEANSRAGKSPAQRSSLGAAIDLKSDAPEGFAGGEATADIDAQLAETTSGGSWYAVAKGRKTGVFRTWKECKPQVENLFSASFKKFSTKEQAEAFVTQHVAATKGQAGDPDPRDPNTLVAFCDGSALENGRRGCRAGYACIFPHREEWNVAKQLVEGRATNNRAEYMAALEAMKRANVEDPEGSRMLFIFSDSMLLIRSMTEWVGTWQKNNWKKSDGASVQNRDLLELLMTEKGNRRIRWTHVKAHTGKKDWGSKWNDVADHAARNAALSVSANT